MADWDIGDAPTVSVTWADAAGMAIDAMTVVTVKKPDGSTLAPTATHGATGVYTVNIEFDQPGFWRFRFVASGGLTAAEEKTLFVRRSVVL